MCNNGLQNYMEYWKNIFLSNDPITALGLNDFQKDLERFEIDVLPEPYYGYFHEDMTNDVLLLLLNPGAKGERTQHQEWDALVKKRYTELWSKEYFVEEEEEIRKSSNWRDQYLKKASDLVNGAEFLHTMEFFPFHSRKDELKRLKYKWMNHISTELAFQALKDIAVNHKTKAILNVVDIWNQLLEKNGVPLIHHIELKKHTNKEFSFQFKVYKFTENSLPILYCKLNGSMGLPKNKYAVQVARRLLEFSSEQITSNEEFEVSGFMTDVNGRRVYLGNK
jgi:hypothetical protein